MVGTGLAAALPAPARAQTAPFFDVGILRDPCAEAAACVGAVQAVIAGLRENGSATESINEALGILAAVLIERARGGSASRAAVAAALQALAEASTDSAQALALRRVAALVADTDIALESLDTLTPVAASPS
ncbi:MAG: hypothetical protein D6811_12695 [Alphaproteobacteria bacterium]|nr:MAG: hypothetical protein D6811_12695 [Alphaproteobacteria bacterium]